MFPASILKIKFDLTQPDWLIRAKKIVSHVEIYLFIHGRGFRKIYPSKPDKVEIQNHVTSQVDLHTVSFTVQRNFNITITKI